MTAQYPPADSPLEAVTVEEAMRPGVVTCLPEDRLPRLAAIMVTHGIHAVVLAPLERPAPLIVTDRALVRAAFERSAHARAADIAREPVAMLPSDAALDKAVAVMAERYVAHVLATDPGSGAPAGVVSSFDVAAVLGGQEPRLARILRPAPARPSPSAGTLSEATVDAVMHPGVATCTPDAPLSTVARTMAEHRVHSVAVAGIDSDPERGKHFTWGLIEDMDLVLALHWRSAETAARIAVTAPIAVKESESLERAAKLMVEHDRSHVVAVGRSGLPSGIVSTLDVARILAAGA